MTDKDKKFTNDIKKGLYRFVFPVLDDYNLLDIKKYLNSLVNYDNHKYYNQHVIKKYIVLKDDISDEAKKEEYYDIKMALLGIAALYYGDPRSIKMLRNDYDRIEFLNDEELKKEVKTFITHILFGPTESKLEKVGDLQIEQKGLIPIIDEITSKEQDEQQQKVLLREHLRVYGILSEKSLEEAMKETEEDIRYRITSENTQKNKQIIPLTEQSESFVGRVKKRVTFTESAKEVKQPQRSVQFPKEKSLQEKGISRDKDD